MEFRLEPAQCAQATSAAEDAGMPVSEFVRRAVLEKLERDGVAADHAQVRDAIDELLGSFRDEIARLRDDLLGDHQQAMAAIRAEAMESLRKNEEATRVFILALTQALGGGKPSPSPAARGRREFDPDAPMAIPG